MSIQKELPRNAGEDYAPEIARQKAYAFFGNKTEIVVLLNKMTRTDISALAVFLDEKSLTTTGYAIPADYGMNRASSVVHRLIHKFSFPVSSRRVISKNGTVRSGNKCVFFIKKEDLKRLKSEPATVFDETRAIAFQQRDSQALMDLKRLVREYGQDGVIELLKNVANDDLNGV